METWNIYKSLGCIVRNLKHLFTLFYDRNLHSIAFTNLTFPLFYMGSSFPSNSSQQALLTGVLSLFVLIACEMEERSCQRPPLVLCCNLASQAVGCSTIANFQISISQDTIQKSAAGLDCQIEFSKYNSLVAAGIEQIFPL